MMVPSAEGLAAAYARIAPELGLPPRVSEAALRLALQQADHLSDDIYDVPAALLFAFGRTPRCFGGFRAMGALVVAWHAKTLGFQLAAAPRELAGVILAVARSEMTHEDVKAWVVDRMLPFGG
jgi:hypothetical protein